MFGSFQEEGEPCVYGTRSPLNSWDPLWSNLEVYWSLLQDSWHARSWADKLRGLVQAARLATGRRGGALSEAAVRHRQGAALPPADHAGGGWFGAVQFAALLLGVVLFLWHADAWRCASPRSGWRR